MDLLEVVKMEIISTKFRSIVTSIPSEISLDFLSQLTNNEPQFLLGQPPVIWDKAVGFQVFDPFGNIFIDFSSGVLVANCGHSHPHICKAIIDQVNRRCLSTYIFPNEPRLNLTNKLLQHTSKELDTVFLLNTGSEAIEACIKLSKALGNATQGSSKNKIITFKNSFHGRTMGSQLAGGIKELKSWIHPIDPTFVQVPFPDGIYCEDTSFSVFEKELGDQCINNPQAEVCAVIMETYQGGIVKLAPKEYIQSLRDWCHKNGALLIFDEVQAGFGRTGKWWGFEHYGVEPDMFACGKGISSSLPLACVIGSKEVMNLFPPGSMSTTHSGNPICCAAAVANVEVIENERLCDNSARLGRVIRGLLVPLEEKFNEVIRAVCGEGMVWGIHIKEPDSASPNGDLARKIVWEAVSKGVLMFSPVGPGGATIKINPPLNINEDALIEGIDVLISIFQNYKSL
jgi:4-aminobutyrate aminotransferase / (S)-3-amino-2-methylpropionate transaminase / 5-aminovalerate transaminase